jgi:N-acetylglucosaminyldiphosphoundecaprenol N-acetyl-beta-D-mannosaminyltransferase
MKKVTILALHLGYGGIERAITDLANNLVEDYNVTIVSTYKLYDKPVNELNKKVKVEYLTDLKPNKKELKEAIKKFKLSTVIKEGFNSIKILSLKKQLMINYIKNCNSDVIISTRDIHNFWLGKYGSKKSLKIGWEHNHHHGNMKYAKRIIKSANCLDYLVLVSKDLTKFYKDRIQTKCIYIPNMIEKSKVISKLKDKNIISIGRLEHVKGYSDLIDVFELVNKEYPDWTLNIIGDGTEKEFLQHKIKDKNLEDKVILHGYLDKQEMEPILKKSSIYVMSSLSESFGIVLLEAFSYGIPCIAFDSAEGAREIITNSKDGYLIKERNKEKMKDKICELINSYDKRLEMGKHGLDKSLEFDSQNVKEKWINLIK